MNIYDEASNIIYDYTASNNWEQVKDLNWTTAEVQELIVKILNQVKNNVGLPDVSLQSELLAIAALDKIAHPIKYLQEEAKKDGCKLDGYMAIQLTQDANFYQEIADKALKAIANCG